VVGVQVEQNRCNDRAFRKAVTLGSPSTGVIAHVHPETLISKQQTHQSGEPIWHAFTVLRWLILTYVWHYVILRVACQKRRRRYHNERVTVVMQIYVFQYIFLLSIQLCCYHTFPQRSYAIQSYLLLAFYISK